MAASSFYRHSGVTIASEFSIPEWSRFECTGEPAQVTISLSEHIEEAPPSTLFGSYADNSLKFSIEREGVWEVSGSNKISVCPADLDRMDDARLFTLGSAWGALGYQRGWPMIHGSAVELKEGSALFCGDAEHGKSTLAAALTAIGGTLLSDDLSRLEAAQNGHSIWLYPSATRLKLWDEAIEHFGWSGRTMQQDHFRDRKYHMQLDDGVSGTDPRRLDAVFILKWGNAIKCERLRGVEAVKAFSEASMYRREFLELMERLSDHVVFSTRLAGEIPIFRLTRPRDFAQLDLVCDTVTDCLSDAGATS